MKKYRKRSPLSESDKAVMWDRWLQGDSLHAIARLLGASHTSVRRHLLATGSIRPAQRQRSTLALSLSEREEISRGIVAGHSTRCIARTLGRAPSTISRELHRTGGRQRYRACQADHGRIKDTVSIRQRPSEAEDRAVPGHWEGDLLCGTRSSQTLTLVERYSRYVMLARLRSKNPAMVVDTLIKLARKLPLELYKSLKWDRGTEMAGHTRFSLDTDIQVYFCDPKSPWQRGSNENTNGLLRQYFPKGMDLSN